MTTSIVDFTTHPSTANEIGTIRNFAADLMADQADKELWTSGLNIFTGCTLRTLFAMLQEGYTPFARDVAEAVLMEHAGNGFMLGRHGLRELTSTWAKEKFPLAKYEIVITLVKNDGSVAHTFLTYT